MSVPERSSKVPDVAGQVKERPPLKFTYSTEAYDSYVKEGLEPPDQWHRPDKFELRFLSAVDLTKGKIKVEVTRMVRLKAQDFSSDKREYKEYLVWESNWYAKNWLENELVVNGHIEGKYKQQTLKLVNSPPDPQTGQSTAYYEKDAPRVVHTIPFTKTTVDKLLNGEPPFGPDSVNITDPDRVVFYGKFENILGVQNFRCADFTYDQFIVPEWKQFVQLAIQEGGPQRRVRYEETGAFIR
jgi:hypothetical protein